MTLEESLQNLRAYEQDTNPLGTIRDTLTTAYDNLRPELEAVHKYEQEQLPSFYDAFTGYGMGTGSADMDPLTRLRTATGDVARKGAIAMTARDVLGVRQARMEDLIKQAMNQWSTGYGMAQDSWQRAWAQKQHEDQMALAREQMARSSGGVPGGWNPPVVSGPTDYGPLINQVKGFLESKWGGDKKVSPTVFQSAYNMFNQGLGGMGGGSIGKNVFANMFADYINESHSQQYLDPNYITTSKKSSPTTSGYGQLIGGGSIGSW